MMKERLFSWLAIGCLFLALSAVSQAWMIHRLQVRIYDLEDMLQPAMCMEVVAYGD